MSVNNSLQKINLRNYCKEFVVCDEMISMLESNYSLTKIYLPTNNEKIDKIMERNKNFNQEKRFKTIKTIIHDNE